MKGLTVTDLAITSRVHGDGIVVLTAVGEIDLANCAGVDTAVSQAINRGRPLVLDLSGVTFLDSSGLRTVLTSQAAAARANSPFFLVPSPIVRRVLELAGINESELPTHSDVAHALDECGSSSGR